MGIGNSAVCLLSAAKSLGADFATSLTIGRQFFHPSVSILSSVFACHKIDLDPRDVVAGSHGWAERFFQACGALKIDSLDTCAFEGASIIHDLNIPIPLDLKSQYSLVFDGGTLEHVFNYPEAIKSCMELLQIGGHFVQITPANNYMGHGFFQFSPELMFSVFSKENGFQTIAVFLHEDVEGGFWYLVSDPSEIGRRVQMTNRVPTSMCTIARKIENVPVFATVPQQADYESAWGGKPNCLYAESPTFRSGLSRVFKKWAPVKMERFFRNMITTPMTAQPAFFTRLSEKNVYQGRLMSPR